MNNNRKVRCNKNEIMEYFVKNTYISSNTDLVASNLHALYYYNYRVLYNYHTPIALINVSKYEVIYINKEKYSRTTTRNQNLLKYYAINNDMIIIDVSENELNDTISYVLGGSNDK